MATRIAFSTHWPERMGDKAGNPNYFPERIIAGVLDGTNELPDNSKYFEGHFNLWKSGYKINKKVLFDGHSKTTTIRANYAYWKSKEGQLIQPFIWDGKPYRSKHVLFCPPVRLREVSRISIKSFPYIEIEVNDYYVRENDIDDFAQSEGFDSVEDFFLWFNEDFEGAMLKYKTKIN